MNLATCKGYGRLFNVISNRRLCPDCVRRLEDKFQEVKEYLNEHPNASVNVVSEACEVTVKQIKEWVRDERLSFTYGSADALTCDNCGQKILTGRFCVQCKQRLQSSFESVLNSGHSDNPKKRDRDRDRMRFLQDL